MDAVAGAGSMGLNPGQEMGRLDRLPKDQQVKQVSEQFEGMLIRQFLKDALKPMFKGYLNDDGPGSDMYQYFMVDTMASSIAKGGGFGIAHVLQMQLDPKAKGHGGAAGQPAAPAAADPFAPRKAPANGAPYDPFPQAAPPQKDSE